MEIRFLGHRWLRAHSPWDATSHVLTHFRCALAKSISKTRERGHKLVVHNF